MFTGVKLDDFACQPYKPCLTLPKSAPELDLSVTCYTCRRLVTTCPVRDRGRSSPQILHGPNNTLLLIRRDEADNHRPIVSIDMQIRSTTRTERTMW